MVFVMKKYKAFFADYIAKIIEADSDAEATMKAYKLTSDHGDLVELYEINNFGLHRTVIDLRKSD